MAWSWIKNGQLFYTITFCLTDINIILFSYQNLQINIISRKTKVNVPFWTKCKNMMVFLSKWIIAQKIEKQTSFTIKKYVMSHLKLKFSLFTLNWH